MVVVGDRISRDFWSILLLDGSSSCHVEGAAPAQRSISRPTLLYASDEAISVSHQPPFDPCKVEGQLDHGEPRARVSISTYLFWCSLHFAHGPNTTVHCISIKKKQNLFYVAEVETGESHKEVLGTTKIRAFRSFLPCIAARAGLRCSHIVASLSRFGSISVVFCLSALLLRANRKLPSIQTTISASHSRLPASAQAPTLLIPPFAPHLRLAIPVGRALALLLGFASFLLLRLGVVAGSGNSICAFLHTLFAPEEDA